MSVFEALLLGIVQGFTEFLPVSSSGHLALGQALLGTNPPGLNFEITVHAATVLSTIVVFRKDIISLISGLLKFKNNDETKYILNIIISMIPVMIVGLFFKDYVEYIFGSGLLVVGVSLLITAGLLFFASSAKTGSNPISPKRSFIVGLAQAVAILPGLSRSGATISTGLLLGIKKEDIAKFSFLMVLIPILGEAFLDIVSGDLLLGGRNEIISLFAGFISAFVSGLIACTAMINLVKRVKLTGFAYYCAVVGIICLALVIF